MPVVALWTLGFAVPTPLWTTLGGALGAAAAVVYAMVGPTVCYALPRVLRPHRGTDGDRIIRHPLAAALIAAAAAAHRRRLPVDELP